MVDKSYLREIDRKYVIDVLMRFCPFCKDELKYKKILEYYSFDDFYSSSSRRRNKNTIKWVRLSGCRGRHVFYVHFIRNHYLHIKVYLKIRKKR